MTSVYTHAAEVLLISRAIQPDGETAHLPALYPMTLSGHYTSVPEDTGKEHDKGITTIHR